MPDSSTTDANSAPDERASPGLAISGLSISRLAISGLAVPGAGGATGPVFTEPWQAQAFAIAVMLERRGLFGWPEWAQMLGDEIKAAEAATGADTGTDYYRHWLATLERMVALKGLAGTQALARHRDALARAARRTPHGEPIALRAEDF